MKAHIPWLALALAVLLIGCGGGGADRPEARPLLVVDLNILHGILDEDPEADPYDRFPERIELIAAALAELQPDIIFLQEVLNEPGEDYPNVRELLLTALGEEYTAIFGDIAGSPIDTGAVGQMTLTRLPIRSAENHFVGGVRSVHRVTVETERGPLDLYNVHLEGTEPDPQLGIDEIEDVLAFILATRGSGPVILAGDFNAEPDGPSIRAVLAAGFIDALVAGGDATCVGEGDPGCTSSTMPLGDNPDNRTRRRIDYIFVTRGSEFQVDIMTAGLVLNAPEPMRGDRLLWPSDHIGVQALIELR